jgi:hypothetical protein
LKWILEKLNNQSYITIANLCKKYQQENSQLEEYLQSLCGIACPLSKASNYRSDKEKY